MKDIKDEESYMESMGQARTSQVLRDARIGKVFFSVHKSETVSLSIQQISIYVIMSVANLYGRYNDCSQSVLAIKRL